MDIREFLKDEAIRHPSLQPQDAVKLCFQAAFGAEHLLLDVDRARGYFYKEFEQFGTGDNKDNTQGLIEPISPEVDRVNLAAWKRMNLPPGWLFNLFAESMNAGELLSSADNIAVFEQLMSQAESLAKGGTVFPFSFDAWKSYVQDYGGKSGDGKPVLLHHSEEYRQKERPAYRIISGHFRQIIPVLMQIADLNLDGGIIAVDGRAAAGKTTIAKMLAPVIGGEVIHMDDFFLPEEMRTPERLAEAGGNIHYERFTQEVLSNLGGSGDREFSYRIFDCRLMDFSGIRIIGPQSKFPWRIVEGAYSHHPTFGDYMDFRLFANVDPAVQLKRIEKRNGKKIAEMYASRWIPMEEKYFEEYKINEKAALVL